MKNVILLIQLVFAIALFSSCSNIKIASHQTTKTIKTISIKTAFDNKVTSENIQEVEKSIEHFIFTFNSENHQFKTRKYQDGDTSFITLNFQKIKFVKPRAITTGYIVSSLGLIASPIAIYSMSGGSWILLFWYMPTNRIYYTGTLSDCLKKSPNLKPQQFSVTRDDVMFIKKEKRIPKTEKLFEELLKKNFLKMEKQLIENGKR